MDMVDFIEKPKVYDEDAIVDKFLDDVKTHLKGAIKRHPEFKGIECIAAEFADVVKAVEMDSGDEIRRQCIHLAVVALREYLACWSKGEPMEICST